MYLLTPIEIPEETLGWKEKEMPYYWSKSGKNAPSKADESLFPKTYPTTLFTHLRHNDVQSLKNTVSGDPEKS